MSKILYYLVLKPISLLPFFILYRISDLLYLLMFTIFSYRKKVVFKNLKNSFPDKSKKEIKKIAKLFYRHFTDIILESVKNFSINERTLRERVTFKNLELLQKYYDQKRSIVVIGAHYNNWETCGMALGLHFSHKAAGVYAPLSNKFIESKTFVSRSQFGTELIPKSDVKKIYNYCDETLVAIVFASDQSPTFNKKVFWTRFLNQDTAVAFGAEKLAVEKNLPVIFCNILKEKRGYYCVEFELLCENPKSTTLGEVSEMHTRRLEKEIFKTPQYWLWTHKRWKRKKEKDMLKEKMK